MTLRLIFLTSRGLKLFLSAHPIFTTTISIEKLRLSIRPTPIPHYTPFNRPSCTTTYHIRLDTLTPFYAYHRRRSLKAYYESPQADVPTRVMRPVNFKIIMLLSPCSLKYSPFLTLISLPSFQWESPPYLDSHITIRALNNTVILIYTIVWTLKGSRSDIVILKCMWRALLDLNFFTSITEMTGFPYTVAHI